MSNQDIVKFSDIEGMIGYPKILTPATFHMLDSIRVILTTLNDTIYSFAVAWTNNPDGGVFTYFLGIKSFYNLNRMVLVCVRKDNNPSSSTGWIENFNFLDKQWVRNWRKHSPGKAVSGIAKAGIYVGQHSFRKLHFSVQDTRCQHNGRTLEIAEELKIQALDNIQEGILPDIGVQYTICLYATKVDITLVPSVHASWSVEEFLTPNRTRFRHWRGPDNVQIIEIVKE